VCEMKHRLRAKAMIIVKVLTKSQLKKWWNVTRWQQWYC
jgi:hypothetical protein